MAKSREKIEAIRLRRVGKSVGDIARTLEISKGTASAWCQGIELTDVQKERLRRSRIAGGHAGRMRGTEMNRQKKVDAISQGREDALREIGVVSRRDLLIAATALYWAEGSKTDARFIFVNSDPEMIDIMHRFLAQIVGIDKERISITIQINAVHRPRIKKVTEFWSRRLSLPLTQFTKPYYVNVTPKKVYENHEVYYGVVRLRVLKGSGLQYRMLGYINALGQHEPRLVM